MATEPNEPGDGGFSREFSGRTWFIWGPVVLAAGAILISIAAQFLLKRQREVVAYCAQDQVYAEKIFRQFEKQAGVKVQALYDSEAVKTVGLANRLLAERAHPRCDVFWGNEEMRTRQLAAKGIFSGTNGWHSFGYRSRRVVLNTQKVSADLAPRSLLDLTNSFWRGRVALAYPQFGTTSTQFHALRQRWGEPLWESWCRALAANQPFLVDGNSVVIKFVGRGDAWVGLTDSDDIAAGQAEGLPIRALPMNQETLLIPNTAGIVSGAPHPEHARRLVDYLLANQVCEQLVDQKALEGISASQVTVQTLKVNWDALLRDLDRTTETLNRIFLK